MSGATVNPRVNLGDDVVPRPTLEELLARGESFVSYTYSYPHKTAYRPLARRRPLRELWAGERTDALFLYFHVPFCEARCGYCNLFSHARNDHQLAARYVSTLERQAAGIRQALDDPRFARVAIGGGTPTSLSVTELTEIFDLAEEGLGASLRDLPVSLETSPATVTTDKLSLIVERGVDRISIGVQSFDDGELAAIGRGQDRALIATALDQLRRFDFPTLNIDLIYGIPGQTVLSWEASLRSALEWRPEELYLYPLYVRPLTGLGRDTQTGVDQRLTLYRAGRDLLRASGYDQVSMRMFRRRDSGSVEGPVYCCQEDGMIGLGCGARSYTTGLHYSDEWAVGATGVHAILDQWTRRPDQDFASAWYGFDLDDRDQRIRYLLKSLFRSEGLDLATYRTRFGSEAYDDHPDLDALASFELIEARGERLVPTERGLELSDCLGPWLYSERVRNLMGDFRLR